MAKASAAYPNSAPDLKRNPQIFEIWCEMLDEIEGPRALSNLDRHIREKPFFPTISEILRLDEPDGPSDHELLMLETKSRFDDLEQWQLASVAPPAHIEERWGRK